MKNNNTLFVANDQYCTNHQGRAPKQGGKWLVSKNGYTRRFICAKCYAIRQARKDSLNAVTS